MQIPFCANLGRPIQWLASDSVLVCNYPAVRASQTFSRLRRASYLAVGGLFLFFLVYSTPHRVHHLFDGYQSADHQNDGDRHSRPDRRQPINGDSTCIFQSVVSRCHAYFTLLAQFSALPVLTNEFTELHQSSGYHRFFPNAFQIRAPPSA